MNITDIEDIDTITEGTETLKTSAYDDSDLDGDDEDFEMEEGGENEILILIRLIISLI